VSDPKEEGTAHECMLASEDVLAKEWLLEEEMKAWDQLDNDFFEVLESK